MPVMRWPRFLRDRIKSFLAIVALAVLGTAIFSISENFLAQRVVRALSWSVVDKVVAIDPGHGGKDSGARNEAYGVMEKDITLSVANRLAAVFKQSGAVVVVTREDDTFEYSPDASNWTAQHRENLTRRAQLANKNNADGFLSVHVNSFPQDPSQHGAQVFYQPGNDESAVLAKAIQSELRRVLGNTNREAKAEEHFLTGQTNMPAVIIEMGFISNAKEARLLQEPSYQNKIAWAIYAGTVRYFAGDKENGGGTGFSQEAWKPLYDKSMDGGTRLYP